VTLDAGVPFGNGGARGSRGPAAQPPGFKGAANAFEAGGIGDGPCELCESNESVGPNSHGGRPPSHGGLREEGKRASGHRWHKDVTIKETVEGLARRFRREDARVAGGGVDGRVDVRLMIGAEGI
jgi:hypothetical protein